MTAEQRVLRVFISSTTVDMIVCREKVRETILRLNQLPIGMETFTPLPTHPVADCLRKVLEADVVIAIIGHRYGAAPSESFGGDGKRSITWMEVQAAKEARKSVFVFLVDPKVTWEHAKDSDLLNTEPEERHEEILTRIRGLREFKQYLLSWCTCAYFASIDDLATKVATTLSNHVVSLNLDVGHLPKVWLPRVCHALQPAPHFAGREKLRAELSEWATIRVTRNRVISVVAVGGTGKTALAEQVLRAIGTQSLAGCFVWSFYENPRIEEFLRAACEYFTGESSTTVSGHLERLEIALTGDDPHLFMLDGLELVQAEQTLAQGRGEIRDLQLRRFLRWIAAGHGTLTRVLVTSRYPLTDLIDWTHAGHLEIRLEDLDQSSARTVLRNWGVQGDDAILDALSAPLGCHALSIAVLGSYVGKLFGGDPTKAPTFENADMVAADPKAAKLSRILTHYASELPREEVDLLARLSMFPFAVSFETIGFVVDAGGGIAGTLVGCKRERLLTLLAHLRELGLVFQHSSGNSSSHSAHPFLRDHFKTLLCVDPKDIHEAIRTRIVPALGHRPERRPTDAKTLDMYEALIVHTRLAGRVRDAAQLYLGALGGFTHLGGSLGEFARGKRIVSAFASNGNPTELAALGKHVSRWELATDWGKYALLLGDLRLATIAFRTAGQFSRRTPRAKLQTQLHQSYTGLIAGQLPFAKRKALNALANGGGDSGISDFYLCLALAEFRLGNVADALRHLDEASKLEPFYFFDEIVEFEIHLKLGNRVAVKKMADKFSSWIGSRYSHNYACSQALLGMSSVTVDPVAAHMHLSNARMNSTRDSNVEVLLRCHCLAAEIALAEKNCEVAKCEAESGIQLSDTCGFGHYSIELRLVLSRSYLQSGDARLALQLAHEALKRSSEKRCQYAWGIADANQLCGIAHLRLGKLELAREQLVSALNMRKLMMDPRILETEAELDRLSCGKN